MAMLLEWSVYDVNGNSPGDKGKAFDSAFFISMFEPVVSQLSHVQ